MKAFDLTLPPGFVRFDLPLTSEDRVRALVAGVARSVPEQQRAAVISGLHTGLVHMLGELASGGCFLAFLTGPDHLLSTISPSIAFRQWDDEGSQDAMTALLAMASTDPSAELIDIDPAVCLRSTRVTALDVEKQTQQAEQEWGLEDPEDRLGGLDLYRLQVGYTLGVPGELDSWFVAVCSATLPLPTGEDPEEPTAEIVGFFDSVMSTFRWQDDA